MIKKCLTKAIALTMIAASTLALNPIGASAAWRQDNIGWWYTEGDSYAKGWRNIDGSWYYFKSDGYMAKDNIVTGYYLNENGVWIKNPSKEVKEYINKLNNAAWINQYTKGASYKNELIDINEDGVKEMLLFYEKPYSGLAGVTGAIVTYNGGNVKLKEVVSHGGFFGYLKDENVIFTVYGNQGYSTYNGYKIEGGEAKEVYTLEDGIAALKDNMCKINGVNVSKEKYQAFLDSLDRSISKNLY
jgi:hypothetical protein